MRPTERSRLEERASRARSRDEHARARDGRRTVAKSTPERLWRAGGVRTLSGVAALLCAASAFLSACGSTPIGAARQTLASVSRLSAELDDELARQRRLVSAAVIADPSATREDHARAMVPYDDALNAARTLRETQLAVEAALDGAEAGRSADWLSALTCMAEAFSRLTVIAMRLIEVPNEAHALVTTLGALAGERCEAPSTRSTNR